MAEQFPQQSDTTKTAREHVYWDVDRYVSQAGEWPFEEKATADQVLMVSQLRVLRQIARDVRSMQIGMGLLVLLLIMRACNVI